MFQRRLQQLQLPQQHCRRRSPALPLLPPLLQQRQ
jgi:hypothetical protein